MTRLYSSARHEALTKAGKAYAVEVREGIQTLLDAADAKGYSLRDAETVIINELMFGACITRLHAKTRKKTR